MVHGGQATGEETDGTNGKRLHVGDSGYRGADRGHSSGHHAGNGGLDVPNRCIGIPPPGGGRRFVGGVENLEDLFGGPLTILPLIRILQQNQEAIPLGRIVRALRAHQDLLPVGCPPWPLVQLELIQRGNEV